MTVIMIVMIADDAARWKVCWKSMSVFECISRVQRADKFKADHRRQSVRLTMAPLIMLHDDDDDGDGYDNDGDCDE